MPLLVKPLHLLQHDGMFETLAASAPDAILTIDDGSTILSANAAVERIFGYAPSELVGRPLTILIPERLRSAHDAGITRYLRTGRRHISWTGTELPALTKDGREIPVEISFGEFVDESGRRVFSGFVRDVSDRVRYERELEEARRTAEQALKELTTLGRIIDVALAQATYGEMLRELLHRLREELGADEATVMLLNESRTHLAVHISDGIQIDLDPGFQIPVGRGVTGRIAATGQPLVAEDLSQFEVLSPVLREQMKSLAAVPIWSFGELIGVLHVGSRTQRRFTEGEVRLLEVVAERMAGVFARTRLYETERRARAETDAARQALAEREAELHRLNKELAERAREERALRTLAQSITGAVRVAEVMHQIVAGALSVSGAAGAYVEQVVTVDGEVEVVAASGEGVPPVGQRVPYPGSLSEEIIARRNLVFLAHMEGFGASMAPYLQKSCPDCSVLVAPLLAEAEVLGALVLVRRSDEEPFAHDIVDRVRILADLASISLQRLVALAESERRRSEAEAAVRSRDEVLSIVSHDLRNPVSTVAMSASLLKDPDIPLTDEQRRTQLDLIARSAQRMNRLIQDLLDVARIEGGRLTISCRCEYPAVLATEACEAFRPIATDKGVTLDCKLATELKPLHVDRDRVLQVLSNFLANAIKFTSPGGRVTIRLSRGPDDGAVFAVSDTGPGIAPENLPRVFTRFWQAKRTAHLGSGLGLAIAKGIAEAHRGRVRVESTLGKGSTFFLELPRSRDCN